MDRDFYATSYSVVITTEVLSFSHALLSTSCMHVSEQVSVYGLTSHTTHNTLNPRYNAVIGCCPLYRVITRTALYWNEQQKTLVSPCCHFSRLSHHYQSKHRCQRTCSHYGYLRLKKTSVFFVSVRHSAHVFTIYFITNSPCFSLTTWHDALILYKWLHCWSCRHARCAVDAIG